jgi:uncharacterized protein YcfL
MKLVIASLAALTLAGCAKSLPPQVLTKTDQVVIMPDKSLFYCPNVRHFPNPDTLTDVQVSKLLVQMHTNNTVCQKNINSIYSFLDNAKKTVESKKE